MKRTGMFCCKICGLPAEEKLHPTGELLHNDYPQTELFKRKLRCTNLTCSNKNIVYPVTAKNVIDNDFYWEVISW